MELALAAAGVIVLLLLGLLATYLLTHRTPSRTDRERIRHAWGHVARQSDPALRVLEAEKVFALLLACWGGHRPVADGLRDAAWRFSDIEALWRAHKLRNRIAHEPGLHVSPEEAERAIRTFKVAIERHTGTL